jgi:tetratricopeptide (TPR) repeat protein
LIRIRESKAFSKSRDFATDLRKTLQTVITAGLCTIELCTIELCTMLSRLSRLIFFFAALGVVLYTVLLNRESMTVYLWAGSTFTAMSGVVLIVTFALGILTASFVGLLVGIRSYMRERRLQAKQRQRQALLDGLRSARSFAACHEWNKARAEYEQLIRRYPHDLIARVELSRVVEGQGDLREALRLIDAARAEAPQDVEVLMRAAELNIQLKNKTAAIDNLALILASQPNRHAARMARDLSEDLERFEDALEYQERLDGLGYDGEESERFRSRIRFRKLLKETIDPTQLKDALSAFAKRESLSPALERLAELHLEAGDRVSAAQSLAKVARQDGSVAALKRATELWVELNQPEQALSTLRATAKETRGIARLEVELEQIRTLIALRMLDEAKAGIAKLPALLGEHEVTLTPELAREVQALQAFTAVKLGDLAGADATLARLTRGVTEILWGGAAYAPAQRATEAPAPRLSTP